ncbi:uncharacterized protein E5676_scaffold1213G00260 [Cucumis melo var. makuwa]|uniref:CACTA en-spm transposon protein n=1 Tax=Cucumis melo var. makuwa TaxID=1194695 RepID=A0A5A7V4Z9_CUCMM|nr:uncharacterized protein E6C27_scaffold381G00330 [Cucumis melo var. makuwa]TYK27524.1 uncharacterized protein E5676_scaffold1213G00260 [Cucumis melo var. makuwa]
MWDVPEGDDVENEQLNVLKIVIGHRVDEHIEDDTLCRTDVDPTIVERPVSDFDEIDAMFLEFPKDLNNPTEGLSSVGEIRFERYVHANWRILILIAPSLEKPILLHVVRFSRHFKKSSDPKEALANPPHILVTEDAHATLDGFQPLSKDEVCETVLDRRSSYSKGFGWEPKPKSRTTTSVTSASTSCLQSTVVL